MTPLQMELHSARQARLARMGAWHRNVPLVPSDRVRPRPTETPVRAIEFKPEPTPLTVSTPAPVAKPDPIKIETWFRVMEEGPRKLRVEHIQRAVALHYGVDRDDILSHRRTAKVMEPRQVAAYLCKRLTAKSLPEIGRKFGGRDHTTILHSVRRVEIMMADDPDLAGEIRTLETRLRKLLPAQCPTCGSNQCEAA